MHPAATTLSQNVTASGAGPGTPDRWTLAFDAIPLLATGGISNYVRPLLHACADLQAPGVTLEGLFRLGWSRARLRQYVQYRQSLRANSFLMRRVLLPDRAAFYLIDRGLLPVMSSRAPGVFLSTTDYVPRLHRADTKLVMLVYDLIPLILPRFFKKVDAVALTRRLQQQVARADLIVAISEATQRDVRERLQCPEEKVVALYPGVGNGGWPVMPDPSVTSDSGVSAPAFPWGRPGRPYICYLGALALNKNVDGLLRIFAACVRRHGLDLDLYLSGRDFCKPGYWRQLAQTLKIGDRVHFSGWIADHERDRLLQGALMLWQFSWYEGFGLPLLEAAAQGVPVLCSNRGASREVLDNRDQEIDPDDEEGAIEKAATACQSADRLKIWSRRGLERAAMFSWQKSAATLLERCRRLLAGTK